jgi:hypothetical protein
MVKFRDNEIRLETEWEIESGWETGGQIQEEKF